MDDLEMETWDKSLITKDNYDYKKSMLDVKYSSFNFSEPISAKEEEEYKKAFMEVSISSGYFSPPHGKWFFHISIVMFGDFSSPVEILSVGVNNRLYRYLKNIDMDEAYLIGPMRKGDRIYEHPIPYTSLTKEFRHPRDINVALSIRDIRDEWPDIGQFVGLNTDMSYVLFKPRNPSKRHRPSVWIDDTHFRSYVASKVHGVDMFLQERIINALTERKETLKEQKFVDWKNDEAIIL